MGRYYATADGEPAGGRRRHRRALHAAWRRRRTCRPRAPAPPWRWPTSSTRWPASSPSARNPAAPRIRSACGARPSACCASWSRRNSISICARWSRAPSRCSRCQTRPPRRKCGTTWSSGCAPISSIRRARRASPTSARRCSTRYAPATRSRRWISPRDSQALATFLALPEAASLTAANKRISNILKKAEAGTAGTVDVALLREPAEKALHEALAGMLSQVERALGKRDYAAALAQARHAASGRRRILRWRHGERRGRDPASQPARVARAAAPAVHAHRGSLLPAGLTSLTTCSGWLPSSSRCS